MKPKFDGYAAQYDAWFMENENLFQSELRLFQKVLGDIQGKRVLSVGCGSGLFESMIDCSGIEGIEPSRDMGAIAEKRGVNVVAFGAIEDVELEENAYDVIYLNGSSSYMEDLTRAFDVCKKALKPNGTFISLDVPKESAFGFMYLLAKEVGTFDHPFLNGVAQAAVSPRVVLRRRVAFHGGEDQRAQGAGLPRFRLLSDAAEEPHVHQRGRGGCGPRLSERRLCRDHRP